MSFSLKASRLLNRTRSRRVSTIWYKPRKRQVSPLARRHTPLATAPDNPQYQSIYAIECMQCGDYDKAPETFEAVLKAPLEDGATLTAKGHALKTSASRKKLPPPTRKAARAKAAEAYYAGELLKTYRFDSALLGNAGEGRGP